MTSSNLDHCYKGPFSVHSHTGVRAAARECVRTIHVTNGEEMKLDTEQDLPYDSVHWSSRASRQSPSRLRKARGVVISGMRWGAGRGARETWSWGRKCAPPARPGGVGTQDEKSTELTTKDTNHKRFTKGKSERKICAKSQVREQAFVHDKGDIFK